MSFHIRNLSILLVIPFALMIEGGCSSQPPSQPPASPNHSATSKPSEVPSRSTQPAELESPTSGIPLEPDSHFPPIPPLITEALAHAASIELMWNGTGTDVDASYRIHRRTAGIETWELIATVQVEGDNRGTYHYQDDSVEGGVTYEYSLTVVDIYGNESMFSEIIQIKTLP